MNIMDQARNDAIKSGISPDYLPPPVEDLIFRIFGAFLLFNFVSYIVMRTIAHFLKKEEEEEETLPLKQPTTLKRLMTLKEESDEDDESPYANPPPLKRTRFEKEEDENIGKPFESWSPLLHVTLQLEERERSTNTPPPQYRIRIPLLPPSPPSSDSE